MRSCFDDGDSPRGYCYELSVEGGFPRDRARAIHRKGVYIYAINNNTRPLIRPHPTICFFIFIFSLVIVLYVLCCGLTQQRALAPRRVRVLPPRTRGQPPCCALAPSIIIFPASVCKAVLLGTSSPARLFLLFARLVCPACLARFIELRPTTHTPHPPLSNALSLSFVALVLFFSPEPF